MELICIQRILEKACWSTSTCCCAGAIEIALAVAESQILRGCTLVLGCLERRAGS